MAKKGCALLIFALPLAALDDPARVQQGLLAGAAGQNSEVRVYKGIPYAAPPTGDLRWKPPQPPAAWQGVRQAAQFSATCMQTPYPGGSIYRSAPQPVSEDCLYLNVWSAAKSGKERRPVMVWIHGGAFTRGSGSTPTYDGEALAAKGVVLVTINYRLGVFGFLAHPELTRESAHHVSGNYALLDQIAALEWVQHNIAAFGGDPKRVTIFGESAGSWAVNYLMATPLAKGLFHRVIGESGGAFGPLRTLADVEKLGEKFAASVGAADLQALRAKPADELLKTPGAFPPNVDGWLLPKDVYSIFAEGKQNDLPLIAGFNADEGTSLAPWPENGTLQVYLERVRQSLGEFADRFLKICPAQTDAEAKQAHYNSFRDQRFGWQMRTWVRLAATSGHAKAYLYYFSRIPPGPESGRYRAYHAAEIQYVFGNLRPPRPWEETDRRVSDAMSAYWVNFANSGNPNGKGLPEWPAYDAKTDMALEFGNQIELRRALHKEALDLFDAYYQSLRSGPPDIQVRRVFGPETPTGKYKHPASITELANGDLYLVWYGGAGEYAIDTAVFGSRLKNGESRWSAPRVVAHDPFRSVGNAVIWQAPDGLVWLFYVIRFGDTWSNSRIAVKISKDGAETWSDASLLALEEGMMVRNRPIVLSDGDYLLPVYHETGGDREMVGPDSTSLFLRYEVKNKRWSESSRIRSPKGNIQPAPVEIAPGHLIAYCRRGGGYGTVTDGYLIRSESHDGGRTWIPGRDSAFLNPNAAVDFLKLRNGHLLLVSNDSMTRRTPLTAAISTDNDRTYPYRRNIAEGPGSFAYPVAIQTRDGKIHVVFTSEARTVINHAEFEESAILKSVKQ